MQAGSVAMLVESPREPNIPKRAIKAHQQYLQGVRALEEIGNPEPTDREVYEALGSLYDKSDEQDDLPNFDTWQSYLRVYRRQTGTQKHKSRTGQVDPSHLPKINDVEPQSLPNSVRPRWAD